MPAHELSKRTYPDLGYSERELYCPKEDKIIHISNSRINSYRFCECCGESLRCKHEHTRKFAGCGKPYFITVCLDCGKKAVHDAHDAIDSEDQIVYADTDGIIVRKNS